MGPTVTTFLMFDGKAEEAMNLYVSLFENSRIDFIARYGPAKRAQRARCCGPNSR